MRYATNKFYNFLTNLNLQRCGGLEQVLVVIVHMVHVVLLDGPFSDLAQQLVQDRVRDVVTQHVQNKTVCSTKFKTLQSKNVLNFPLENGPEKVICFLHNHNLNKCIFINLILHSINVGFLKVPHYQNGFLWLFETTFCKIVIDNITF